MKPRSLPKLATWLLERFASGRHSESLLGDLFEEYARWRGRIWLWRQVASVLVISLVRGAHRKTLTGVFYAGYACCEFAVTMGFLGIADEWRRARSINDILSLTLIFNVLVLIALACFGFYLMKRARRFRHQPSIHK